MRTVMHIFGGITIGAGVNTAMMALLEQTLLVGPFALITVTLAGLTAALWYLDYRVRHMLFDLCERLMELAAEEDKPLIYHDASLLHDEIKDGKSLTLASIEIGVLAAALDMEIDVDPSI